MTTAPAVRAVDLRYARGGRTILDGVSLEIDSGTSTAIMGPSGSGKSTLLALLAGLEPPDRGEVVVEAHAEDVGLILQGHGLISLLTAEENVALPLQVGAQRSTARQVRRRSRAALDDVRLADVADHLVLRVQRCGRLVREDDPRLADVADHLVEALSGGQQQRVSVARALIREPRIVLADEATASLDAENREVVMDLLFARAAAGATLVLATHDEHVAARADRVLRVAHGRLVEA
jgi:ABC-type lipoprotein export system ATPase subunit